MNHSDQRDTVLVTGGTGFVGRNVVAKLRAGGWRVRVLARGIPAESSTDQGVRFYKGDALEPSSVRAAAEGCAAIIHLIGIIRETRTQSFQQAHVQATANAVRAAIALAVPRYIQMSALGTRENAASQYHKTKWEAEQLVRSSSLCWTIFRPGLIHGPGGEFTSMVMQWHAGKIPPYFFMPFFGGGFWGQHARTRVQPILVGDLADLLVRAINTSAAQHQTYELGGPEAMTWPAMLEIFNSALPGPRRLIIGIPFWLARALSTFPLPGLPFNRDQVIMASENNVCDLAAVHRDFPGFAPQTLADSARQYLNS